MTERYIMTWCDMIDEIMRIVNKIGPYGRHMKLSEAIEVCSRTSMDTIITVVE